MTDIKKLIMENRNESRAIKKDLFASDVEAKEWARRIEEIRVNLADYAKLAREGAPIEMLKKLENQFYDSYKGNILPYFENVSKGEKLHATASDFGALLSLVGVDKRNAGAEQQEFTFVGEGKFRKIFENFVADRINEVSYKSAEDIKAERIAKREAKKAARKAEAEKKKQAAAKTEPAPKKTVAKKSAAMTITTAAKDSKPVTKAA